MFARIIGAAKRDDLRVLARGHRQMRAGSDDEIGRIGPFRNIFCGHWLRFACICRVDQKCRQYTCQPRQFQGGLRLRCPRQVFRQKRPFQRRQKIKRGISYGARGGQGKWRCALDEHGGMGRSRFALVDQFESGRAGGRNEHLRRSSISRNRRFCRQ